MGKTMGGVAFWIPPERNGPREDLNGSSLSTDFEMIRLCKMASGDSRAILQTMGTSTSTPLQVLVAEDSENDAELLVLELRRKGYSPIWERVQDAASMRAALSKGAWDIVISDSSMPQFSAQGALAILKETGLDIPFVIVSGTIGEETAVAAMRAGASDFLLKDNLARLGPVVERELRESRIRSAR